MWKSGFCLRGATHFSPQGMCGNSTGFHRLCGKKFLSGFVHSFCFHNSQGLWNYFGKQNACWCGICSFLVSPRKEPKECDLRGAERRAPARRRRPLKNHQSALTMARSTLTYLLFGQKMFRFFARRVGAMQYRLNRGSELCVFAA